MGRALKEQMVREITDAVSASTAVFFVNFQGLTSAECSELRGILAQTGGRMKVVRNRLARIGLKGARVEKAADLLKGPTAAVTGADPVGLAKVITAFRTQKKKLGVHGGVVEGQVVSADDVEVFSKTPPREVLLASVVGGVSGLVPGVIAGVLSMVGAVLDANEKRAQGAEKAGS